MIRRVEHVMGMPISLALRGRHAGDAHGDAAWAAALEVLRAADRTFSTYRADSVISRMNRGVPVDTPPEVADVLAIGAAAERSSGGAFAVRRGGVLDPSGVVKGWAAERAAAAPWRIGIEDPRDPTRLVAVVPLRTGAVATSGTAHRGAHIVDARTGRAPGGLASVTVVGRSLTAVDVDATAAFALGADGERWLTTRGHRAAFVVRTDGTTGTL